MPSCDAVMMKPQSGHFWRSSLTVSSMPEGYSRVLPEQPPHDEDGQEAHPDPVVTDRDGPLVELGFGHATTGTEIGTAFASPFFTSAFAWVGQ